MKLMATLGDGQDTQEKYRFKLDKKTLCDNTYLNIWTISWFQNGSNRHKSTIAAIPGKIHVHYGSTID